MFRVDPAHLASSPAPAEPSAARALIDRQVAALSELAEIGMEIARAAGRAATAPAGEDAEDTFHGDPCLAYTRVARAVRLTFALQAQLLKDLAALEKAESKADYDRRFRRRQSVQRLVEEALDAERPEASAREFERLCDVTRERLREADEEADLLGRPFAEIVARICADLGLPPERTAAVVAGAGGFSDPSPSGLSRGSMDPLHHDPGSCAGGLDPRDEPEDDGGWDGGAPAAPSTGFAGPPPPPRGGGSSDDTFLEWPPPSG